MPDSSQPQMSTITSVPDGRSWRSRRTSSRTPATPVALSLAPGTVGARTDSSVSAAASASAARLATRTARRRVSAAATMASSGTSAREARPWVRAARASPARTSRGCQISPVWAAS